MVITGASGGIGAASARAFAAEGARVLVHYNRGEERARALSAELGGAPIAQADLTQESDVERLFDEARAALDRVDVCVEVQGVWPREDVSVRELSLERWEETLRANLTTTFLVARSFLREVERNGHGSLVLVGSTAGVFGEAGHADYAAAKSAVIGGLAPLAQERDRADRPARACERRRTGLDGVADDARPRRPRPGAGGLAHDGTAQGRAARGHRGADRRCSASDTLSGHVTGQVVVVAGGMEGRTVHEE